MSFLPVLQRAFAVILVGLLVAGCNLNSGGDLEEQKDPHFIRGKSRANSMDYVGAVEAFEDALEANPRNASAHFELGVLYETKMTEGHAAAIYHFEKFLKLRPASDMADVVRQHITACKLELAKTVSFALMSQEAQRTFDKLNSENTLLKQQVEQLRMQVTQQAALITSLTNQPAPQSTVWVTNATPPAATMQLQTTQLTRTATPERRTNAVPRLHTIKAGETLASIARKYGIALKDLQAANPGVNPKKLKVDQSITIPPKS
ncbi:MAG: LysM peptidoglycan-binding domain-containing protein [Verrucomicrobiota bacterium]